MKPSSSLPAPLGRLLLLILLLLQLLSPAASVCSVNFRGGCGSSARSATSNVTFAVIDDTEGAGVSPEYEATVVYHWGPEDTSPGAQQYTAGQRYELVESYSYPVDGEHIVGYSVTFGPGAGSGCEGRTFSEYFLVTFDDTAKSCVFKETAPPTPPPTIAPTPSPTTLAPSKQATAPPTTASPTKQPTNEPTIATPSPTKQPTNGPTKATPSPTKRPVASPTDIGLNFNLCGNGICADTEHADNCPADCTGMILTADLEGAPDTEAKGIMFSVMPWRDISVTSIDVYSEAVTWDQRLEVFTKVGGYDGFESDSTAWKKVYDNYPNLQGPTTSTRLSLNNGNGVTIPANTKWSFFIHTESRIAVKDGSFEGNVLVSDDVLEIYQGIQVHEKWAGDIDNVLAFRGSFIYDVVELPDTPATAPPTNEVTKIQGSEQTLSPTGSNVRPSTPLPTKQPTPAPIPSPGSTPAPAAPSVGTPAPVALLPTNDPMAPVSSVMVLYHSGLLNDDSERIWTDVTQNMIHAETVRALSGQSVTVNVELASQKILTSEPRVRRSLQSSSPLQLLFTTTIETPPGEGDWDEAELVAAGFETPETQQIYLAALKERDGQYFQDVESLDMKIEVDGKFVSATDFHEKEDAELTHGGGSDNTQWYIIAGVAVGAIAVGVGIGMYSAKRKRQKNERKQDSYTAQEKTVKGGIESDTRQETTNGSQLQDPCFGVIESREGDADDISTLGDPYMGDAVNAQMATDNTVGESMVSSQQELYVYGVRKTYGGDESRAGNSTLFSGSKALMFGDDTTLEDIFHSPSGEEGESNFQKISVVAPAGKLGLVIDNPHGNIPLVYAIKESSALNGKVRVGDLLLSVDGTDCRGMSAHKISGFLRARSQNPERTLLLARGTGLNPSVTVSDVMPSRKKSQGKARKASKAANGPQQKPDYRLPKGTETRLMETMLTNSGCTHGCEPISQECLQFVYEFYTAVLVNVPKCRSVLGASHKAISDICLKIPEMWHGGTENRDLARACIIANAATILAGDATVKGKQIAGGSVVAVLLIDKYDEEDPKEPNEIDFRMSGSTHWRLRDTIEGDERLLLSFFHKLVSCDCLDERYAASKATPKSGICERCCQRKERSELSVCTGCCLIQYCSIECQARDWSRHRRFCKAQRMKAKEEEAEQGTSDVEASEVESESSKGQEQMQ